MKKSILLGAAALAAMTFAGPSADAGEVKFGGYYMFRVVNADDNVTDEGSNGVGAGADDMNLWSHRLQMNVDMKASEKSHAHMRVRVIDSQAVSGADVGKRTGVLSDDNNANGTGAGATGNDLDWDIRQLWLETEAWGVGVKVGEMPLSLNDKILVNNDTTSFGSIVLAKSFGDVTVAGMNVRVVEAADGSAAGVNENNDDIDLYGLTVLGKMSSVNYQLTGAYLHAGEASLLNGTDSAGNADSNNDWWLALTLGGNASGVDLTGTVIYENGMDVNSRNNTQGGGDGLLLALRAKGKVSFGGWNAYAMYAGEDYTNIVNGDAEWSPTWDMGGTGANDLMKTAFGANNTTDTQLSNAGTNDVQNLWAIGAGLAIDASGWTIKPYLDYANVVDDDPNETGATTAAIDSAWGGSLILSTKVDTDTTLELSGNYVDPDATTGNDATAGDAMHQVLATVTMKF